MPAIVPASVLGRGGRLPPSERIAIGIIGVGYQAHGHLEFLLRHPESRVLAVCDVDKTRREDAKRIADTWYGDEINLPGALAGGIEVGDDDPAVGRAEQVAEVERPRVRAGPWCVRSGCVRSTQGRAYLVTRSLPDS